MSLSSKDKDTIVNTLVGLLLLAVFSLPFVLGYAALEFVGHFFWPHIADRLARYGQPKEILELGVLALVWVTLALQELLRRKWTGVLYCFGMFSIGIVSWLAEARLPNLGRPNDVFWFGLICLLCINTLIESLHTRYWTSAFLCALILMEISLSLMITGHRVTLGVEKSPILMLPIFLRPDHRLTYWEFSLLAVVAVLDAVNRFGLIGNDAWSQAATVGATFALVGWFLYRVRKEEFPAPSLNA